MAIISYSYLPFDYIDPLTSKKIGEFFRPYVTIRVQAGHGLLSPLIDALVDSGADRNLFPFELASVFLKLDESKMKPKVITGIGNIELMAYTGKFYLWVNKERFEVEADFCKEQKFILLGRSGFFSLFKSVKLRETDKFTDLEFFPNQT